MKPERKIAFCWTLENFFRQFLSRSGGGAAPGVEEM